MMFDQRDIDHYRQMAQSEREQATALREQADAVEELAMLHEQQADYWEARLTEQKEVQ